MNGEKKRARLDQRRAPIHEALENFRQMRVVPFCNSRTARRVSENTDCNCVNFNREASETQVFSLKFLKSDGGKKTLNTSSIKNFDELPLFLNAQLVSRALGVSPSSAYELLHEDGFPSLRIGSRLVVPKEQFRLWVERQTGGAHEE